MAQCAFTKVVGYINKFGSFVQSLVTSDQILIHWNNQMWPTQLADICFKFLCCPFVVCDKGFYCEPLAKIGKILFQEYCELFVSCMTVNDM